MTPEHLASALATALNPAHLHVREPLAPFTTFRVGGPADVRYDAMSADDLATAVIAARTLNIPWLSLIHI